MKDKPPTTESLQTARKIAERMREVRQAIEPITLNDDEARQYPAALPAPTDYERGFADHADFVQTWMQEQADEVQGTGDEISYAEYMERKKCAWAFRYVLERYNERHIESQEVEEMTIEQAIELERKRARFARHSKMTSEP